MTISLHIDRLVIDRVPVQPGRSHEIQAAVEATLTQLLGERGVSSSLINAGAVAGLDGGALRVEPSMSMTDLGGAIATAVHATLAGSAPAPTPASSRAQSGRGTSST